MQKPFGCLIPLVFVASALIGCDQINQTQPKPTPSPLVLAARNYINTLPDAYDNAAQQIKSGKLANKTAVIEALKLHAKPLADAMDVAFNPLTDDQGTILNAPAAANVLEQVALGLRGK